MAILFNPYASVASILADFDTRLAMAGGVVLGALSLSGPLTNGTASTGTILGTNNGSTVTSNVTGLTVNSGARTYSFDGTATAATIANGLVETLAGATNSPRSTPITVAASTGAVAPTFANTDMIFYSDSRSDAHGVNGLYSASGYAPVIYNRGVAGWIGTLTGHRFRVGKFANYSISGGSAEQAAQNPRQAQNGTVVAGNWWRGSAVAGGSDNKGYVQAGQDPAGIVFIQLGTNGFVAGTGAGSSFAAIQTIIAGILAQNPNKVIILSNELPKGIANDGTVVTGNDLGLSSATYQTYAQNLMKLSFDSGDALANPRVISVDTAASIRDTTQPTYYRNRQGTMPDGLHPSAIGAKLETQAIVDRLSAVYGATYTSLPSLAVAPTTNGLASQGNSVATPQPYLNRNPNMTAGNNGTVSGTNYGTAPTTATVPEGYTVIGTATNSTSIVLDKTTVPNELLITITGTATAATTLVELRQTISGADLTSLTGTGQFTLSDKLRPLIRRSIAAGSQNLTSVYCKATVFGDTTAKNRVGIVGAASAFAKLNDGGLDAGDGVQRTLLGEVLDLAEPNMAVTPGALTSVSSMLVSAFIEFNSAIGDPISATVRITQHGIYRSAS